MRIFVTGASGFIGHHLCQALRARGDEVVAVSRHPEAARARLGPGIEVIAGNPTAAGDWQDAVAGADAVVNLASEPIADRRWNAHVRQIIHDSRVDAARHVVEAIARAPESARPAVLVSASGIDYYPTDADLAAHVGEDLPPVTEN
ncbi:MAG TPA: NAD-dependent epimerase/dehydratase family protein, partial [Kofleriaceae bacterium]|nr:NAD-dependent epimerase/dehydratase family protein [Kofleriaceae bacterium]